MQDFFIYYYFIYLFIFVDLSITSEKVFFCHSTLNNWTTKIFVKPLENFNPIYGTFMS